MKWHRKILHELSSLKIAVVCLLSLFVLTIAGTVYQVNNGLFAAQHDIFYSWIVWVKGMVPLPGAQFVLWVLFINMFTATIYRIKYRCSKLGIIIIHFGLLFLLFAGFVTHYFAQEGFVSLKEGEATSKAWAYTEWDLAVAKKMPEGGMRSVTIPFSALTKGRVISIKPLDIELKVLERYENARPAAMTDSPGASKNANLDERTIPESKSVLEALDSQKEPVNNTPALVVVIGNYTSDNRPVPVYGAQEIPSTQKTADGFIAFRLVRHSIALPFTIRLKSFEKAMHPGTGTAKKFESVVSVEKNGAARDVLISMNNPLRDQFFTFYQASYSMDPDGTERSTLAVVENSGRLVPYIATIATFIGLLIHFGVMFVRRLGIKKK